MEILLYVEADRDIHARSALAFMDAHPRIAASRAAVNVVVSISFFFR